MGLFDWLPFGAKIDEIDADALRAALERGDNLQLVDVRTEGEFRQSHINGAKLLPIANFTQQNVESIGLDPSRPVIVICRSAHRSVPATRKLQRWGFDAKQLRRGMMAWWAADYPAETG